MIFIPLQPIPNQSLTVTLNGQSTLLAVYQKGSFIYVDITTNGIAVRQCRMAHDRALLVRYAYLGFLGDLAFIDMQGKTDPFYTGLGSRYQLVYLSPADLLARGISA